MRKSLALLVLALACAFVEAGGPATPEEAFKAMLAANGKSGPKGAMSFLTRDSQRALAGGIVISVCGQRNYFASGGAAQKERVAALDALIKKHGIEPKKLKEKSPPDPEGIITALIEAGAMPKDPIAFTEDAVTTLNKIVGEFASPFELVPKEAVLRELRITGETAKGILLYPSGDEDVRDPISFRREAGAWRIDLLPSLRAKLEKGKSK